jgi:uncharacterized protein (DUF427 family)
VRVFEESEPRLYYYCFSDLHRTYYYEESGKWDGCKLNGTQHYFAYSTVDDNLLHKKTCTGKENISSVSH